MKCQVAKIELLNEVNHLDSSHGGAFKICQKNGGFGLRIKYLVTSGLTHMDSAARSRGVSRRRLGFGTEKSAEISAFYELITADDR